MVEKYNSLTAQRQKIQIPKKQAKTEIIDYFVENHNHFSNLMSNN